MRIKTLAILFVLMITILSGCSTTKEQKESSSESEKTNTPMPEWYEKSEAPDESMVVYGFGASQAEPDYPDQMRRQARMNAATQVVEQLEQTVQALTSEYFDRQDLGDKEEARTRQELKQTTEQWYKQELVGLEYDKTEYVEDRWFVRAKYDLNQDFDRILEVLDVDSDKEAKELKDDAGEHLQRLDELTGTEEVP